MDNRRETLTKDEILYKSIHLFAEHGYDNVTVKNIAAAVGIRASSIYNHYINKDAILQSIYRMFIERIHLMRPRLEDCQDVIKKGTAFEILNLANYPLPEPQHVLFDVVRIVWGRAHTDCEAREIYKTYVINEGIRYTRSILDYGVEIGRICMRDDQLQNLALTVLAIRCFSASAVVIDPDQMKWREIETNSIKLLEKSLSLTPPMA